MKLQTYFFLFLLMTSQFSVAQQVERENVLLEGFTGTW